MEKNLGIEVERDEEDGSFTGDDIAKALRKAMVSEEGERLRARAREAADGIFRNDELHGNDVEKFAEYLKIEGRVGEDDDKRKCTIVKDQGASALII